VVADIVDSSLHVVHVRLDVEENRENRGTLFTQLLARQSLINLMRIREAILEKRLSMCS
jgi:hypothetical protein